VLIWITLEFSFFRLAASPLQLKVAGPYLVRGVWFPRRMLLD
jgi:hypothetical protein